MSDNQVSSSRFTLRAGLPAWSAIQPAAIEPVISSALRSGQEQIETLCQLAVQDLTFANTFLALEEAENTVSEPWGWVSHLTNVCDTAELREVYRNLLPQVSNFFSGIPLNDRLYQVLNAFATSSQASSLNKEQTRFVDETLFSFRQHGAELAPDLKKRLQEVEAELSEVTQKFSENVMDSRNDWEMILTDENDLAGLPGYAREAARTDALKKGYGTEEAPQWRITQQAPSLIPFMRFSERDDLRRKLWEGSGTIGNREPWDNLPLIRKVLALREEKARLLGKTNFPDLVLERRMARNGSQALTFVERIAEKVRPAFLSEIHELQQFKARLINQTEQPAALQPWEIAYWSEKLRHQTYDFNEEEVRAYFPVNRVLDGLFHLVQSLFGIRIQEVTSQHVSAGETADPSLPEVWESHVHFYELYDGERLLGSFYTDWFPRDNKRGGAWMNHLVTGFRGEKDTPHLGLVCGNLTPPSEEKPALLSHEEVETIFHEFGHLLHHLLGEVTIRSLNGINVAWDFVELPSQIMENWCWQKESLDLFARHYQTGEPIPEALWQKMLAARNFQSALQTMRQLSLGKMDLDIHLNPALIAEGDIDTILRQHLSDYLIPTQTHGPSILRSFGHLFSSSTGYAAGYYSYKWAEVLDADAFGRFQEEGILNPDTGRSFVQTILSRGNSEEPGKLFEDFRGRAPDEEALLRRAGLAPSP